jgi:hypothetical protein
LFGSFKSKLAQGIIWSICQKPWFSFVIPGLNLDFKCLHNPLTSIPNKSIVFLHLILFLIALFILVLIELYNLK